jgi:ComF family protein
MSREVFRSSKMISFLSLRLGTLSSRSVAARRMIIDWLIAVREALAALMFPWSCPVCGEEGSGSPFCRSCRQALMEQSARSAAWACPRCALSAGPFADLRGGCAVCRDRSLGFDAALALGPYNGDIQDLCLRLKHESNAWLAPWLSDLFVEARRDAISHLPRDAWVVPVPLHWRRRWWRGYNQAEALAHGLARRLNLPVHQPLRRLVATKQLAHKGRTARAEIMHGAFRARPNRRLVGRTVLLIDDVLTTGATCGDAARALKKAGAARVIVVVIARTERQTL